MIPYGNAPLPAGETLARLGVSPGEYYLYVSRLEPENNAHLVIALFERLRTQRPLLVVGDAPYSRGYIARLRETRDPRIRFPGAIYGDGCRAGSTNAERPRHGNRRHPSGAGGEHG
jgi:glycosyltransferase involved in cell wall biosynthesis